MMGRGSTRQGNEGGYERSISCPCVESHGESRDFVNDYTPTRLKSAGFWLR